MAAGDIYQITGGLKGRYATAFLGGAVDDGIQVDAFALARGDVDTTGTFTAWINVPDITGSYAIIGCGDASVDEFITFSIVAGKLEINCTDNTTKQYEVTSTNVIIKPHNWQHVAVVHNGVRPTIYVDGVAVAMTDTVSTTLASWFKACAGIDGGHIGAAEEGGAAALTLEFKGGISNVKYWNSALTSSQIVNDFKGLAYTTTLLANWDMNNDYVNAANPGTYNGSAVGDIILTSNYSEFTSRFRNEPAAPAVVADDVTFTADNETGYAIIVKAA